MRRRSSGRGFGHGWHVRLLIPAALAGLTVVGAKGVSAAEDAPAAGGGSSQTSAPTTQSSPTTQPSERTYVVKKGSLNLAIDGTGTFQPVEPFEVRIRPDAYKGELKVTQVAAHGSEVKQGNILIQFDTTDIKRDLEAAENDLTAARSAYAKAEADARLGEQGDALALKMAEDAAANAAANLKWWDELTGPQMLRMAELRVKQTKDSVEDQQDELEQLRKMYKSEDLTTDTADIVIKRALRSLDLSKVMLGMQEDITKRTKALDHPNSRKMADFALQQAKQALAQLQVTQSHAKVLRQTGLTSARLALNAAEKKAGELRGDLEKMTVTAPSDGIAFFGSMSGAAWAGGDPKALKIGEKATGGTTLMTLFAPGKVKVAMDLPEAKLSWIETGAKATVTSPAWPQLSYEGKLAEVSPLAKTGDTYGMNIELPTVDAKIRPGMKAQVKLAPKKVEDVLVAPTAVVAGGKVKVKGKDGKPQEREVKTGRSDGQQVEILSGVEEGDEILLGGGPRTQPTTKPADSEKSDAKS
jgi:HlyD family secretion protein